MKEEEAISSVNNKYVFTDMQNGILQKMRNETQRLEKSENSVEELYKSCIIDPDALIIEPPVLFKINGNVFGTLGNISLITGDPKTMKSMLLALMTAGALGGISGFIDSHVIGGKIIYFDTEQSNHHAKLQARRIKKLSDEGYRNVEYVALRSLSCKERLAVIKHVIETTEDIKYVIIDGITDLVASGVNDESEAIRIIVLLMQWSEIKNLHITTVLHTNKAGYGSKQAKGHLGSYLQQKCETVLIAKKEQGGTVSRFTSLYSRGIEIKPFSIAIDDNGIPYLWDSISQSSKRTKKESSLPENYDENIHQKFLKKVFEDATELNRNKIIGNIRRYSEEILSASISENNARNWLNYYKDKEYILQDAVKRPYRLNDKIDW